MMRCVAWAVFTIAAMGAQVSFAEPSMLAKVKSLGLPATNCHYCHTEKLPKKGTFTPGELNDRGKWLLADKDARKLKAVDLGRLKDYPGGTEQR